MAFVFPLKILSKYHLESSPVLRELPAGVRGHVLSLITSRIASNIRQGSSNTIRFSKRKTFISFRAKYKDRCSSYDSISSEK